MKGLGLVGVVLSTILYGCDTAGDRIINETVIKDAIRVKYIREVKSGEADSFRLEAIDSQ